MSYLYFIFYHFDPWRYSLLSSNIVAYSPFFVFTFTMHNVSNQI